MTHLSDIEVKVTDLDILIDLVAKHKSGELRCPATALIYLQLKKSLYIAWACFRNGWCFLADPFSKDPQIWHSSS